MKTSTSRDAIINELEQIKDLPDGATGGFGGFGGLRDGAEGHGFGGGGNAVILGVEEEEEEVRKVERRIVYSIWEYA